MHNFNNIKDIEAYLRGTMDREERQAFETQLATDVALQKEVVAYRRIFSGFKSLKNEKFGVEVEKWIAEAKTKNSMKKKKIPAKKKQRTAAIRPMWQKFAVAASVALLVGLGGWWFMSQQYSNEHLAIKAYSPPLASGTMGAGAGTNKLLKDFEEAHRLFQKKDYNGAATLFSSFLDAMTKNPEAFDPLTKKFYVENARWSLLMAQFAEDRIPQDKLLKVLDVLSQNPSSEYAQKAKKLKKDLESVWR